MADKEATIFILDLGASMAERHLGRNESDLDWSLRYVWDKITDIVAANRKTLCVGVVGLRTDETANRLQEADGYEHISVIQELSNVTMSGLRALQSAVRPSRTLAGDAISAIVVAIDMMDTFTKKLKWIRRIVLVTDGQGELDADDIGDIAKKMNDSNIQLTILGVDFDDAQYGFKEEDKPMIKAENEKTLKELAQQCTDGVFATIAEAIHEIDTPRVKSVKPYKTYEGPLVLGDPEKFPTAMCIYVERYFKTHLARPLAASTVVVKSEQATQSTQGLAEDPMDGVEFSAVKQARTYRVNDPNAPGGKRDVEFESLAKGYEYGRTAVHISESEYNITKLETEKSFAIVGFVLRDKYEHFLNMGEACVTHASKNDVKSEMALSSLVWALLELESYAVARIVTKDGKEPLLVLLVPHVQVGFECLFDVPLPFAEDVRTYQFPPLDKVITVSGQVLTKHRLLPSDELSEAMNAYVDSMDLSEYQVDDDGKRTEYAPIDETFNPSIHRVNHAVKMRAAHPDKPISATPAALLKYAAPPEYLIEKAQSKIDALVRVAEVKKVPPKAKGRRNRETVKPISGLDVDALLGKSDKKAKVSAENPVPDFKRMIDSACDISEIEDASKQMGAIVRSFITDSFGDSKYAQAMECLGAMRDELVEMEEPEMYNTFVRDLKKGLLSGALGGDRRDFWFKVRWSRLGLIDNTQAEVSNVTHDEAEEFYKSR
ncbi:hypothetical protein E4U54_003252 [Claviceps lovelessii]|nr:hypothetical protein E4U54_003252 [Claviceps lovelessii]